LIGRVAIARRPSKEQETTDFWWVIENALTTIIFLLVGLELIILDFNYYNAALWGLCAVFLLFGSRLFAVLIPNLTMKMLGFKWILSRGQVGLMTWCGLRGTVSLAMAVAIPMQLLDEDGNPLREMMISGTFAVVLVTLIVQGLSLARVAKRLGETDNPKPTSGIQ
jgi:CPA1 family monovalent cation:H+ antiporter